MPTKFLTLMNPHRRRRRSRRLFGAALMAHRRRVGRNPRRRRHRTYSVRRRSIRRVRIRRNPAVRARRRSSPPRMTPAMRAKISRAVKASFRRRAGSRSVARRSSRRRFSASSSLASFKSMVSKPLLLKAGGAVGASFLTGYVLTRWGTMIPGASNRYGRIAISVGIPFLGAYLVRKRSRDLAEGMVIGGLVMGINALLQNFAPNVAATAGAATQTVSAYGSGPSTVMFPSNKVAGELGFSFYPKRAGSLGAPLRAGGAFKTTAWGR